MNYGQAIPAGAEISDKTRSRKKPGFFKRWLMRLIKDAADADRQIGQIQEADVLVKRRSIGLDTGVSHIDQPERALQFTVYIANGGRVVETRRYDKKTDRNTNGLYVINNDADFGKEIDKIITMESLR